MSIVICLELEVTQTAITPDLWIFGLFVPLFSAIERFAPSSEQPLSHIRFHVRFEHSLRVPLRIYLSFGLPEAYPQPRQESGPKRGRFRLPGPHHTDSQDVRLKLHQQVVARSPTVYSQFLQYDARIGLHGREDIGSLIGDRLERRSRQIRCCRATC